MPRAALAVAAALLAMAGCAGQQALGPQTCSADRVLARGTLPGLDAALGPGLPGLPAVQEDLMAGVPYLPVQGIAWPEGWVPRVVHAGLLLSPPERTPLGPVPDLTKGGISIAAEGEGIVATGLFTQAQGRAAQLDAMSRALVGLAGWDEARARHAAEASYKPPPTSGPEPTTAPIGATPESPVWQVVLDAPLRPAGALRDPANWTAGTVGAGYRDVFAGDLFLQVHLQVRRVHQAVGAMETTLTVDAFDGFEWELLAPAGSGVVPGRLLNATLAQYGLLPPARIDLWSIQGPVEAGHLACAA